MGIFSGKSFNIKEAINPMNIVFDPLRALSGGMTSSADPFGIVGKLTGADDIKKAADEARRLQEEGMNEWQNLELPDIVKQQLIMENPDLAFNYSPEMLEQMQYQSSVGDTVIDPRLEKSMSLDALSQLQGQARSGLTAEDLSEIQQMRSATANAQLSRDNTLLQRAEMQGQLDPSAAMALRGATRQNLAQQEAELANQVQAQRKQARMEAIQQAGQMASDIRNQSYNQQAQVADQSDAITKFNKGLTSSVNQTNIDNRNSANLAKQNLIQQQEDQRATNANTAEIYNKGLKQTAYGNQLDKMAGLTNQSKAMSDNVSAAGAARAAAAGGLLSTVAGAVGTVYGGPAGGAAASGIAGAAAKGQQS